MSRRASLFSKQQADKARPKVRFPDELVFLDNVKEGDMPAVSAMLRRASVQVDINAVADSGMTPLHQAVIDGNLSAVKLLVRHGADINKQDEDTWTPLHAACAQGEADIARYLLHKGADKEITTDDGERPIDLVEPDDFPMIRVMLDPDLEPLEESDEDGTDEDEDEEDKGDDAVKDKRKDAAAAEAESDDEEDEEVSTALSRRLNLDKV